MILGVKALLVIGGTMLTYGVLKDGRKKKRERTAKNCEDRLVKQIENGNKKMEMERLKKHKNEIDKTIKGVEKCIKEGQINYKEVQKMIGPIKFKDKYGKIHQIDFGDHEGFNRMMADKDNTLLF